MKRKVIISSALILLLIGCVSLVTYHSLNNEDKHDEEEKANEEKIYQDISTLSIENNENVVLNYQKEFNNADIIAELSIENTDLVTPVAKGSDNEYYLNHLLDKSKNGLGSVFLDYRNDIDDRKILILSLIHI